MEENETPHPDYLKGFNEGYVMATHLPELSEKLVENLGETARSTGFRDGRQEFILEQTKNRVPDWLKSDRLSNLDNLPNKSKDKDKGDPER